MTTTTRSYVVDRSHSDGSGPCTGFGWLVDAESGGPPSQVTPLHILGQVLPAGSRIRVTVEVIEEGPALTECPNPWHLPYSWPHWDHETGAPNPACLPIPQRRLDEHAEQVERARILHEQKASENR